MAGLKQDPRSRMLNFILSCLHAVCVCGYSGMQLSTGKRGFVFTRSSFVGSGGLGGHWTGDNTAAWDHMQFSVVGNDIDFEFVFTSF